MTQAALLEGTAFLARGDSDLAQVVETLGPPPLWAREPGFATLIYIILEQQVSLASARAAFRRLTEAVTLVTPASFLKLDDADLKAIGFSRQKMAYGRILAQAVLDGDLNLEALQTLDDNDVRIRLTKLKGIGRWTADIYLMEALLRPDIWPASDLALAVAVQRVKRQAELPGPRVLEELGEMYRPWRSVAARLFWHHYLSSPPRRSETRQ